MKREAHYKKGDKIGGRYLIHDVKMGGMGEFYLCLDLEAEIPLALKTFQQRFLGNAKLPQSFTEEVAIWVKLESHPNIVRCHQMDFIDQQPFMFLEWISSDEPQGSALRNWLRYRPLELKLAITFSLDLCNGLLHAQAKQPALVHRDLKPENILIAPGRIAKITDFGLAEIVERAELTATAKARPIAGTPVYMAPEQWRGEVLDQRADIYALGCILYELLTQQPPYAGNTQAALQAQYLNASIPKLLDNALSMASLNAIIARCLAKQRDERFADVAELQGVLAQLYQQHVGEQPRMLPQSSEFTAAEYLNRGNTFVNLEWDAEALADYEQARHLNPTLMQVYYDRGIVYGKVADYPAALAEYNQAIQLEPSYAPAYVNRANVLTQLQRYGEALADFAQAIALDPADGNAFYNRGVAYEQMQRWAEAVADYEQAIQLEPAHAQAYLNRGVLWSKAQRYAEALADLTQAIALAPDNPKAYSNRGNTYAGQQHHSEAVADFTEAIRLDPGYANAYFNRAVSYGALQRFDEALLDLQCVTELTPHGAEVYMVIGSILTRRGALQEALAYFARAAQLGHPQAVRLANAVREALRE